MKYLLGLVALLAVGGGAFLLLPPPPARDASRVEPVVEKHQEATTSRKTETKTEVKTAPVTTDTKVIKHNIPAEPLAVGDKKYSSSPKVGYIYTCQSSFTGRGAFSLGDWADTVKNIWWPSKKPTVDGAVKWDAASAKFSISGDKRVISSNALPVGATTGIYPIQSSDDAYQYDRNPNSIKAQTISYSFDLNPTVKSTPTCVGGEVGIAINGVPIFDGFDAEGRDAAVHEIQDSCGGHPQISGEYHYHNLSPCLNVAEDAAGRPALIGYAFDGFGIYGPYAGGKKLTTTDLDECHGTTSDVVWNGEVKKMYHYVATDDFPYTVGCFRGTPVRAAVVGTPEGGGQGGMQGPPPDGPWGPPPF